MDWRKQAAEADQVVLVVNVVWVPVGLATAAEILVVDAGLAATR